MSKPDCQVNLMLFSVMLEYVKCVGICGGPGKVLLLMRYKFDYFNQFSLNFFKE